MLFQLAAVVPFLDNAIPKSGRQLRIGPQRTVRMARLAGCIHLSATTDTARDHYGSRAVVQPAALEGSVWAVPPICDH